MSCHITAGCCSRCRQQAVRAGGGRWAHAKGLPEAAGLGAAGALRSYPVSEGLRPNKVAEAAAVAGAMPAGAAAGAPANGPATGMLPGGRAPPLAATGAKGGPPAGVGGGAAPNRPLLVCCGTAGSAERRPGASPANGSLTAASPRRYPGAAPLGVGAADPGIRSDREPAELRSAAAPASWCVKLLYALPLVPGWDTADEKPLPAQARSRVEVESNAERVYFGQCSTRGRPQAR